MIRFLDPLVDYWSKIQKESSFLAPVTKFILFIWNMLKWYSGIDLWCQALESVDGALVKLEQLLQDLHVSNSKSGKEHIKAACSDLEKIRKLKKEAEFLEASFRAKAASLRQVFIFILLLYFAEDCVPAMFWPPKNWYKHTFN